MFRILDLGAHDGYISDYLARRFPGLLHIDGVELHPGAAAAANERNKRNEVPGEFRVGMAEDASGMFDPGTYDLVIAYELIEHVKDVDLFLRNAETMCNDKGQVWISTPNGTFGEGNNPHHLRTYRLIDLVELLRRRGELEAAFPGPDGVAVIGYTPAKQIATGNEVAIYCGPCWEPWQPLDIETKGLGGSETAATRLAEELTNIGFTVTVYGEFDVQGVYHQATFRHHTLFDPAVSRLATIYSRAPQAMMASSKSKKNILWCHDTDYRAGFNKMVQDQCDAIMVLSEWHKRHWLETYPFTDPQKLFVTSNGINPDYFNGDLPEKENAVIYSSSPDRGLDLLLEWWPTIHEQTGAELRYCYSSVYDAVAAQRPDIAAFRDSIRARERSTPGVKNLGSLSQPALVNEMEKAAVWVAPSFSTPEEQKFYETYCIGAVEASAAGCRLVMSNWGALPERSAQARDFTIVDSLDFFPEAIIDTLEKIDVGKPKRSKVALDTSWRKVARDFKQRFYAV